MEIRQLSGQDAAEYLVLRHEGLRLNPEAFGSSYEEELLHDESFYYDRLQSVSSYTLGAFNEDSLVGVVSLVPEGKLKMKHRANIYAMYVKPDFRGNGIGKLLMKTAIKKAIELKQIEQIYLSVTASNQPAKKLYESLGFEVFGFDKKALRIGDKYYDEEWRVLYL